MLYSHIAPPDDLRSEWRTQSTDEHNKGVAKLTATFSQPFGFASLGNLMGMLHDKGKEQAEWQKYIQGVTGYNKDYAHVRQGPNHSYVGACIAQKLYPQIAPLIAQPIAGHHRGLYDYCDYIEETKKDIPSDVTIDKAIPFQFPQLPQMRPCDLHHLVRMLFSCLVDADSLDTEAFMIPEQVRMRGSQTSMSELLSMLERYLQGLKDNTPDSEVNRIRNYVQEQCVRESQGEKGFYSLTVPTGGGKTLASVLWALHHAVRNQQQRIIIAIPYTSIIVQTAATLKAIFGTENVLEHHSNVNPKDIKNGELRERLQLATENWDYPIIVTTNVQLFESLFSNRRSDCRKLHNIANSIIILDEVQTLPSGFYRPIVDTLETLHRIFSVSVLFTTASQPILTGRIEGTNSSFEALTSVHEIIPAEAQLHDKLRRVKLEFLQGKKSYDEIAGELARHQRVLCIVNTRRDAKELFSRLPDEGIRLHLSRMMCPAHIASTIQEIKGVLKNNDGKPIRVIATQLVEAGVDIDFPVVFRQEAGLDSILQAAGRCNREGKHKICTTYVFNLAKEHPLPPGFISQTNFARLNMGQDHDWFSPESMTCYFQQLHSRIENFDEKQMEALLYKRECEFEEAANQFRLIDDQTTSIIINWKGSMGLYQQLKSQGPSYSLMKELAQYSVAVRNRDSQELQRMGVLEQPFENIFALTNPAFYCADTGLSIENKWLEETYYRDMEHYDKEFCIEVWGDIACFTRPELKVERVSYDVMTPSAARAIFEAIFWKPAIHWQVTKIEVLNPIKWVSVRRNEVGAVVSKNPIFIEDKRQQKNTLMLRDVRYRIWAKLEFIPKRKRTEVPNLFGNKERQDENPGKYNAMFERRASKGQCFTQPYLGARECSASFRLVNPENDILDAPITESRDLGIMLYDMDFETDIKNPPAMFYRARMENGVIIVPPRNSEEVLR